MPRAKLSWFPDGWQKTAIIPLEKEAEKEVWLKPHLNRKIMSDMVSP
jgi:hypothetical protein